MGKAPCCDKANVKKGPWSPEEDAKLKAYIEKHGTGGNWIALPRKIGLKRCGKSCRLRWLNYLRPNIKHGGFSEQEDNIICSLYLSIGSRWSIIAAQLPGRTDNDIKNYWHTRLKKKLLGKQRKDQRSRSAVRLKQEMKMESENLLPMEAIKAYPHLHEEGPLPAMVPLQEALVQEDQAFMRNLLIKLGGNFYDDHHLSSMNNHYGLYSRDISYIQGQPCENSCDNIRATSTSLMEIRSSCSPLSSSYCPNIDGMIANNFQYCNDIPAELDEFKYNHEENLDGLGSFSGVDMVNRSTNTTTTPESTRFVEMNSLVYSPLGFNYEMSKQAIPENCILQDSRHFGMQQRQCNSII